MRTAAVSLAVLVSTAVVAGPRAVSQTPGLPPESAWPSLRGPYHDGSAAPGNRFGGTAGSLAVRWRAKLGSGYSGVAIASRRAVTMFSDGRQDVVVAFDVDTGKESWRVEIAETLDGRNGSFDGPLSTPAIADGRVFALGPRGHLVAVELATGRPLWRADLVDREGARKPEHGFTSSPIVVHGVLVVQIGADKGRAVAGFDPASGERRWTAGDDVVEYQSPVVLRVGRRDLVIAMGDARLFGIEPKTGRVVFEHAHGGRPDPIGGASAVPVPAGDGRLFVKTEAGKSTMLRVVESAEGGVTVQTVWTAPVLHTTYSPPVYHDGYLFGMNGRAALACVEAATGKIIWRSREPGDGFLALVGSDLVVLTKDRTLHVAPAWRVPSNGVRSAFGTGSRSVPRPALRRSPTCQSATLTINSSRPWLLRGLPGDVAGETTAPTHSSPALKWPCSWRPRSGCTGRTRTLQDRCADGPGTDRGCGRRLQRRLLVRSHLALASVAGGAA